MAAALRTGEVDWLEVPLIDLCPMLRQSPGVRVAVNNPRPKCPATEDPR